MLRISKEGAWGGYTELHALATTMDRPILVVRPSAAGAYDFHHFNPDGKGKQLNLWFQGSHYQYLKGVISKEHMALATTAPMAGSRGCGKAALRSAARSEKASRAAASSTVGGKTRPCSWGPH